jgi:hypothetical protein
MAEVEPPNEVAIRCCAVCGCKNIDRTLATRHINWQDDISVCTGKIITYYYTRNELLS